jgi:hypothetical protein
MIAPLTQHIDITSIFETVRQTPHPFNSRLLVSVTGVKLTDFLAIAPPDCRHTSANEWGKRRANGGMNGGKVFRRPSPPPRTGLER